MEDKKPVVKKALSAPKLEEKKPTEVEELQAEVVTLKEKLLALQKELTTAEQVRQTVIESEFFLKQEVEKIRVEKEALVKESEGLKNTLNELADMYDQGLTAFKDTAAMFGVLDRNVKYTLQAIEQRLDVFNKPRKKE